jgi:hypothetical protein
MSAAAAADAFDALYVRELQQTREDLQAAVPAGVAAGGAASTTSPSDGSDSSSDGGRAASTKAKEAVAAAVAARVTELDEELQRVGKGRLAAFGGNSEAAAEAVLAATRRLISQPRTVGSVFGRDLRTKTDGAAPTWQEQFASPPSLLGGVGREADEEEESPMSLLETEEQRDERLAREVAVRRADEARDTHRDLRWSNRGVGRHPQQQQGQFARDAALLTIARAAQAEHEPRFDTLVKALKEMTEPAVDPRLRVHL